MTQFECEALHDVQEQKLFLKVDGKLYFVNVIENSLKTQMLVRLQVLVHICI